ncbi:PRP38 family-domain-containing protein [Scheffersomyces xylosifermentans]|uniref:PRP38 family-domain-containing protein n=1 Tax=Scheffersomyces xylosifermentans TaxID=1304137 RepID=UPI00315D08C0
MTDVSKEHTTSFKKQASYNDKRNVVNKAHLIEPIIRHRIQDSIFYKQYLYLTNEASILQVIVSKVKYVAGTDSNGRPSPFISCLLRLLELEPSSEIIDAYMDQLGYNEFKYLTALVLIYVRLTGSSEQVYRTFDKYFQDFRKLRFRMKSPTFNEMKLPVNYRITYMDEWVDDLLSNERVIDTILPRLIPRQTLVERGQLAPREYSVEEEVAKREEAGDEKEEEAESEYESDSD